MRETWQCLTHTVGHSDVNVIQLNHFFSRFNMIDPKGDWTANLAHSRKDDGLHRITLSDWELGECAALWGMC